MININYRDTRPIYEQVRDGLRSLIVTGVLSPREKLPSVRELAAQLAINPNTIQRAYRELELQGYIASVPGKGSFVCGTGHDSHSWEALDAAIRQLNALGVSNEEILQHPAS